MNGESSVMKNETGGLAWRVTLSILVSVGWIVFLLLWLVFYASEYSWEKNVAIFLLSLLVLIGVLGVPWAFWAYKKQTAVEKEMWKQKGFKWRFWVSIIIGLSFLVFLIFWFWMLADPYGFLQNLAISIVVLLIAGGLLAAMWAPWGMRNG